MKQVHHSRISERLQADTGAVKAMEINARKSMEHYFRWAVEAAANAIVIVNAQGEIVMVNAQAEMYFGYKREELIGQTIESLVPERFRDQHRNHRAGFLYQPQARQLGTGRNLIGLRKDGSEFPVEIGLTPITTEGETLFLATIIDITQRKQADEALSKSQERYRSLFTNMLDGFAYCRMEFEDDRPQDFVYLDVNPAFENLTGLKDVIGRKVTEVIPGIKESNPELLEIFGKVTLTGKPESFETYVEPLGIWLHISVYSPEKRHFATVFENITDRKRSEEALRSSEAHYRMLSESARDAIFVIGKDDRIEYVNSEGANWFDKSPAELIGLPRAAIFSAEVAKRQEQSLEFVVNTGVVNFSENQPFGSGRERWVNTVLTPIKNSRGQVQSVLGIARDITTQRQAEEALRRRLIELEALYKSGLVFSQTFDEKQIGDQIIQVLEEHLDWHHAAVRLAREDTEEVELLSFSRGHEDKSDSGKDKARALSAISKIGQGMTGWVLQHGLFLTSGNLLADERYIETFPGMRSGLYIPIKTGDRTFGCISVESDLAQAFNENDERLLATLAGQAAAAIDNARLYKKAVRAADRRAVLYRAGQDMVHIAEEPEQVYEAVHHAIIQLMPAEAFVISLLDEERKELEAVYLFDNGQRFPPESFPLETTLTGKAILSGESLCLPDVLISDFQGIQFGSDKSVRAILVVPLRVGGIIIGAISAQSYEPGSYNEEDKLLLEMLAAQAAIAIENARLFRQARERAQEQTALYETTREFGAQSNLEKLLNTVTERAVELLGADRAAIYLLDVENNELKVVADTKKSYIGIRLKMGEGMAGRVAQSRQPMIVDDYLTWEHRAKAYEGEDIGAVLEVPMLYQGELLGVLFVNHIHNRNNPQQKDVYFTQTDSHLLELFAGAAAGAVYSARLFEQTHQRVQEQTALYDTTRDLAAQSDLKTLLKTISERAASLLNASFGAIYQFDAEKNELEVVYDTKTEYLGTRLKMGEGIAGHVAQSRQPVIVDDYQKWEFSAKAYEGANFSAVLEVPMLYQGELVGVIVVYHSHDENGSAQKPRRFTQDDAHLLELFASSAAGAVYSAMLLEQTRRYARQMENINALGRALAQTVDLNAINERLARASLDLMPESDTVFIYQYDSESKIISTVYGLQDGKVVDVSRFPPIPRASPKKGTLSKVATTGKPLILDDLQAANNKRNQSKVGRVDTPELMMQSALYVPMAAEGKVIGVLQVQRSGKGRYARRDAELLSLVANTAAVALQNALLFTKLQQRVDQLSGLHAIDTAIGSTTDLRMSLRTVLDNVIHLLEVDSAAILLMNPTTLMLEHFVSRGFRTADITQTSIRFGDGPAGQAAFDRKLIHLPDPAALAQQLVDKSLFTHEGFQAYVVAPLVAKGQVRGVLEVYKRSPLPVNQEWQNLLKVMANQASLAVDSGQMFEGLGRANLELTLAYDATIEGWSQALDLRDKETEGHTRRVTDLTLRLSRLMEIPPASTIHIRRGALLHDIGKMGIPDRILFKPGKLTEEEWKIMRRHPEYAYDLLSGISYLRPALEIPYSHHEKWDGSGYPVGLKDENIPLSARIFAVVDVYDALISDRPYRRAWSKKQAISYIRQQSGKHFDPRIAKVFLEFIKETQKHS
jgi:PAS domain S-box-containing protein